MGNIALQLYSVRELTSVDFLGTLKKVAEAGYDGVEFVGYFGVSSKELRKALDDFGLQAAGSHIGIAELQLQLDPMIEYLLELNSPYMICPGLPENMRNSTDSYLRTAELLDRIGERCKEHGIRLGYHNHAVEFLQFDGNYGLDLLVNHTQQENLFIELDTYWVEHAGLQSVDFIHKYKNRCSILHMKDMKSMEDKTNTEVGSGIMDFEAIITAAKTYGGVQWYTVEQEQFEMPQLDSIGKSLRYLRAIV